jgi:uncharacterized membrane protein
MSTSKKVKTRLLSNLFFFPSAFTLVLLIFYTLGKVYNDSMRLFSFIILIFLIVIVSIRIYKSVKFVRDKE